MYTFNRYARTVFLRQKMLLPFSSTLTYMNSSISVIEPQQNPVISHTHKAEHLETHFSPSFDPQIYISSLLNCKNLSHVQQVHACIVIDGMLQNLGVANKLLYLYARFKAIDNVYSLFIRMKEKNPVSWSIMINGFAKIGDNISCLRTFREIIRCGVKPNSFTLPFVIRVCRDMMDPQMGRLIHHIVCKFGLELDSFVCAALIDMYAKFGEIDDARKLFDKMSERDVVTWTVMIGAYGEFGDPSESLVLFDQMRKEGIIPDRVTMVNVVDACARVGAMHKAKLVHEYVLRMYISLDVVLGTAMIDMFAKCGSIDLAREIFDSMRQKNVITWSVMIAAYGYHGMGQKAIDLLPMMLNSGIAPNKITFISLLYACSHSGLVEDGLRVFSLMQDRYSIRPDVKHYTCMVNLLGRAGRLNEAVELIEDMRVEKDAGVWTALLGACRTHGNLDVAEKAAKSLVELQAQNAGHYVLLSNIYAKARRWQDVAKIRELMTHRKVKKVSGWTCIEIDDKIYRFSVGTRNHPRSVEIDQKLNSLKQRLESSGYVPDTSFVVQDVDEELKKEMLYSHSEKLAIAFGLIATSEGTPIRITKNLRVCGDCHTFIKLVSAITKRVIVARDANRFHQFSEGVCSCGDYW